MTNNIIKMDEITEEITFDEAITLVKKEVDNALSKSPLIIREYTKHLTASQGKYIRAVSVITCAQNKGGLVHPNAIRIAAAIEILHLATLVHDDIIDNADIRRGNITLQKKYGKRTAVICGDYLLSMSLKMAASIENKKDYLDISLPNYVSKVCLGELNQHLNNGNINLSIFQYLKIISGKTAALFEASFFAGAIFSGCEEAEARKYRQLGFQIGMIFQLTDDCMDYDKTMEVAHKPVQSDYEQGVVTLPLIHAFEQMVDFKAKAESTGISREEINDAVAKTDGLKFTRIVVQKFYNKAMRIINGLDVTDSKKTNLVTILNKAARLA